MKCIYCCVDKNGNEFIKKEHVIPQAFGKFRNNLTLIKKVCDDCNQYLGDTLEIALARDTPEGIMRFLHGIKEPADFKTLGSKTRLKSIVCEEGHFKNAYMKYTRKNGIFGIEPREQIGFLRKDNNEYDYFLLSEFPSTLDKALYNLKDYRGIHYLCDFDEAKVILNKIGIPLRNSKAGKLPLTKIQTHKANLTYTFDINISRAICKIAFNYFAKWNNTGNLLDPNFNDIRDYIRDGTLPSSELLFHYNTPIL